MRIEDLKIDLIIRKYAEGVKPGERYELDKPRELELSEKLEHKNLTLRQALQKLVELVF